MSPGRLLFIRIIALVFRFLLRGVLPLLPLGLVRRLGLLLFSKSGGILDRTTRDPQAAQLEALFAILDRNRYTDFGEAHGFATITTYADYRRQVPIRSWDALHPYIDRVVQGEQRVLTADAPVFFGTTSGTTGPAKLVPVTPSYMDEFRRSRRAWMRQVIDTFPGIVRGHVLSVHSPRTEGTTPGGVPYGSITAVFGQQSEAASRISEALEKSPLAIHSVEDFEARYYLILRQALSQEISLVAAVNPSTVALLCRKLTEHADALIADVEGGKLREDIEIPGTLRQTLTAQYKPDRRMARRLRSSLESHGFIRPIDLWPRLCGVLCWKGGSAPFYLRQLPRWFGTLPVMDYGYAATEGSFSVPLDAEGDDGVVAVMGHFLEFAPAEGFDRVADQEKTVLADALEVGRQYRVIVTGSHGLYRYDINDVVEVTGMFNATPRVRFSHKGGKVVSITGEKVTEAHVVTAVAEAATKSGVDLAGFSVGLQLPERDETAPRYVFGVEPAPGQELDLEALREACDAALKAENIEYAAKRNSQRLAAPALWVLAAGSIESERARRVAAGAPDAHVKPPHLEADLELLERFERVGEAEAAGA